MSPCLLHCALHTFFKVELKVELPLRVLPTSLQTRRVAKDECLTIYKHMQRTNALNAMLFRGFCELLPHIHAVIGQASTYCPSCFLFLSCYADCAYCSVHPGMGVSLLLSSTTLHYLCLLLPRKGPLAHSAKVFVVKIRPFSYSFTAWWNRLAETLVFKLFKDVGSPYSHLLALVNTSQLRLFAQRQKMNRSAQIIFARLLIKRTIGLLSFD